jgi:hypothetical protein
MPTSKRKVVANRMNGRKSHGPTDTTSTHFNATKHGSAFGMSRGAAMLEGCDSKARG